MATQKDTATDPAPESIEALKAELEAVKKDAAESRKIAADAADAKAKAEARLADAGGPVQVTGSYKGFKFVRGQKRVRNQYGKLCDAQMVMDAAQTNDKEACGILDWLIESGYSLLVES